MKLDGYSGRRVLLNDMEWLRSFLVALAKELGVTIVNGPTLVSFKEATPTLPEAGISGFVVIATSHMAFHTWPETGYVQVDISSCKPFDPEAIRKMVIAFLNIERVEYIAVDVFRPAPPGLAKTAVAQGA